MTFDWPQLFHELHATHFTDVDGAEAAAVLPVSDRLVTRLVAEWLPGSAPIDNLDIRADGDDHLSLVFRVKRAAFLPPIRIRLHIEQQPTLPGSPVLVFRLLSQGLAALASPASRLFDALPPGLQLEGNRLVVRLDQLSMAQAWRESWSYLTVLELHTVPGRLVLTVRGGVPPPVQFIAPTPAAR